MSALLHPEYFNKIPVLGERIKAKFEQLEDSVEPSQNETNGVTVGIRTLNEADKLQKLLLDIGRQELNGAIEIIVVDNESSDRTRDVAKKFGAKVLILPRSNFSYPKSMNMVMEAATHELIFLTVGHAELVSSKSLRAGILEFTEGGLSVAGAFGHALPGSNASKIENNIAMGSLYYTRNHTVKKSITGTMAATGSMLRKSVWEELGKFDERFERGGEDGQLASKMLESGYVIKDAPLLSTHHTHGLNFGNTIKQWYEWTKLDKPTVLDKHRLQKRRPDLDLK